MLKSTGPTLVQIRALLAVAEFPHVSEAAAAVGVSQHSLSDALTGCEEALESRLVEYTTQGVTLTSVGKRVVPLAQEVIKALDALVAETNLVREPFAGTVRLAIIPTVAPYLLPTALWGLKRSFDTLAVEVHEERTGRLLDGLMTGRLDLGILATPVSQRGLVEEPLYDEDFVLVVPHGHPVGRQATVQPRVLRQLDVLLLEEGHCLRDQAIDVCQEIGAGADTTTRAANLATLVQLVAAEMGVTLLPETAVADETRRSGLAVTRFEAPAPGRRISLVYRQHSGRSAEYSAIATELRRAIQDRHLPVQLAK